MAKWICNFLRLLSSIKIYFYLVNLAVIYCFNEEKLFNNSTEGATGTGKSKLALQVAKHFNGEIISADAMQVYRGLDIVTNKVTAAEQSEVPHHMIDYLGPGKPTCVGDFRDKALPIIDDLLRCQRLPVVAGGTCYYVEALLWKLLMTAEEGELPPKRARFKGRLNGEGGLGNLSYVLKFNGLDDGDIEQKLSPEDKKRLHEVLGSVDSPRAAELHPNNVRKVIRSLQVFDSSGHPHSELIAQQRATGDDLGGPLRYPDSLIFWVTCDQTVLDKRLDMRVDEMIRLGLIGELQEFHKQYNLQRIKSEEDGGVRPPPYTQGIFQSIGFKEFHDYLVLSDDEQQSEEGQKMIERGVELMKVATRQYARRQVRWIRRRILGRPHSQVPPLFAFDGTDLSQWDSLVKGKALSVVQAVLDGTSYPISPESPIVRDPADKKWLKCEECDRLFEGSLQWEAHMKSEKHKRKIKRLEKEQFLKAQKQ